MVTDADLRKEHGGWLGPNPYYLMIRPGHDDEPARVTEIDLDQTGWASFHSELMRAPGQWYLVRKDGGLIVATMLVYEGEQPYYVARHVGFVTPGGGEGDEGPHGETTNYGIGKKRLDGHVDRIWVLANGCVTLGDDVEPVSLALLKQGLL